MKYIVGVAWKEDETVVSHLTMDAPSMDRIRTWARYVWPQHVVVSIEPHWDQKAVTPVVLEPPVPERDLADQTARQAKEDADIDDIRRAIEEELRKS